MKGEEILLPLHQPETARIEIGKAAHLQIPGIAERAPKLLPLAVENREPIGIVHRGTKVIDVDPIVRPEEEHARQRREAGMIKVHARIDRQLNIENRAFTRSYCEVVGRGRTFTVQQRVHDDGVGVRRRLFDPERLEQGEFLPFGLAGVDRQSPS